MLCYPQRKHSQALSPGADSEYGDFKNEEGLIILLGQCCEGLGGSEYPKSVHSPKVGDFPGINLEKEKGSAKNLSAIKPSSLECSQCISEEPKTDNLKKTNAIPAGGNFRFLAKLKRRSRLCLRLNQG